MCMTTTFFSYRLIRLGALDSFNLYGGLLEIDLSEPHTYHCIDEESALLAAFSVIYQQKDQMITKPKEKVG